MTLIDRVEAAIDAGRELFWEAFNAVFPEPASNCEPAWQPENPKQPIYHAWKTRQVAFGRFVDAEAWEQAALTLVPDDHQWSVGSCGENDGPWACVELHDFDKSCPDFTGSGATEALALCAAALRAHKAMPEREVEMAEVEKIALGLTDVQKSAILILSDNWVSRPQTERRICLDPQVLEMATPLRTGHERVRLTSLGLAVRQYLQEQSQ